MELSILVPTVSSRVSLLSRLLSTLEPQLNDQVEVIVHTGDDKGVGTKCNRMFQEAKGRLVVSIDDDDNVPDDFVETILYHTLNPEVAPSYVDFVGYRTAYSHNGVYQCDIVQDARPSAVYSTWVRHVSLKNPIATEIARQFEFTDQPGGDWIWCNQVYQSGLIKNPIFIDKVLYLYEFYDKGTVGPRPSDQNRDTQRDVGMNPYNKEKFRWLN